MMKGKPAKMPRYGELMVIACGCGGIVVIINESFREGGFQLGRFLLWWAPVFILVLLNVLAFGNRPLDEVSRLQRHPETPAQKIMCHSGTAYFAVILPVILWISHVMG